MSGSLDIFTTGMNSLTNGMSAMEVQIQALSGMLALMDSRLIAFQDTQLAIGDSS